MSWARVVELAQGQHGLVTTSQLKAAGLSAAAFRWARERKRLLPFLNRVYLLAGTPITWDTRARGALLCAGPGSALSHGTAAMLFKLPGYEKHAGVIELTAPAGVRVRLPKGYALHRTGRVFEPWYPKHGLPRTRLARTLIDLAATVDEEALEIALDGAHLCFRDLTTWLEEELSMADRRTPGVAQLKSLLAVRYGPPAESPHETVMRRRLRERGIIPPVHQYVVYDAVGRIMRVDEAWPQHLVAAHGHSYRWHGDRQTFDDDASKRSRLAAAGWLSFEVTSTTVREDAWLDQLAAALKRREPQLELALEARTPGKSESS